MQGARLFLYCTVGFALCCWAVQIGGLAALHSSCDDAPESIANYARANNNTKVAAVFQSISGFNDQYNQGNTPRCSVLFGLQWWVCWAFFFSLLGLLATSSDRAAKATFLAWGMFLSIISALLWLFCQRYNVIDWNLSNVRTPLWQALGSIQTRLQVTYAGYVLESISAILLIFALNAVYHTAAAPQQVPQSTTWAPDPKDSTMPPVPTGTSAV